MSAQMIQSSAVETSPQRQVTEVQFYPFFQKKIGALRVKHIHQTGAGWSPLSQALGPQIMTRFKDCHMPTRKQVISKYIRICDMNDKQPQATMMGAGTRRAVKSTPANKGMSRLPRASVGGLRVVSNIPSARGGRLAQRLMKNQKKLSMNKKERRRARAAIVYHLLRDGRLILIPNQVFHTSTKQFLAYLRRGSEHLSVDAGKKVVLIMRSHPGKKGSSSLNGYLLDQHHHSLYRLAQDTRRIVLMSREGLADLLTRIYSL